MANSEVVLNRRTSAAGGKTGITTVNALRAVIEGWEDVVLDSAHENITCQVGPVCQDGNCVTGSDLVT